MSTSDVVLLVEDDPNDVLLTERAFKKANIANPVDVVNDREEAIDCLETRVTDASERPDTRTALGLYWLILNRSVEARDVLS